MPNYQTEDFELAQGAHYSSPVTIGVEPASGNVQIQLRNAAGDFYTPADPAYTLDQAMEYSLERQNRGECRIIATGGAQFYVVGYNT